MHSCEATILWQYNWWVKVIHSYVGKLDIVLPVRIHMTVSCIFNQLITCYIERVYFVRWTYEEASGSWSCNFFLFLFFLDNCRVDGLNKEMLEVASWTAHSWLFIGHCLLPVTGTLLVIHLYAPHNSLEHVDKWTWCFGLRSNKWRCCLPNNPLVKNFHHIKDSLFKKNLFKSYISWFTVAF
jgi:hypothetical protein